MLSSKCVNLMIYITQLSTYNMAVSNYSCWKYKISPKQ